MKITEPTIRNFIRGRNSTLETVYELAKPGELKVLKRNIEKIRKREAKKRNIFVDN